MLALVLLIAVLAGAWMWLRDSSLVAVQRVRVAGASGPDAAQIRSALVTAARNMTTLDVRMNQLRMAVAPYPVVKSLVVATQFPHGMRIQVVEQVPVAIVLAGGRRIAVSGDGTLLHDAVPSTPLPTISLAVAPGGQSLTGGALRQVRLLAAAPYQLLAKVSQVSETAAHGLVAQLRAGPAIYFGDSGQPRQKWTAAAEVLASQSSAGAPYIDVTDPSRPAAGGYTDTTGSAAAGAGVSSSTTGSSSSGSTAPATGSTAPSAASSTPATPATPVTPASPATGSTAPSGG